MVPMESRLRLAGCPEDLLRSQRQRLHATCLHRLWSLAASFPRQRVFATVGEGPPCGLALKKSHEVSADLIVVGKERRSALGDFLLGSTAQRLLAEAEADVLVLPRAALIPPLRVTNLARLQAQGDCTAAAPAPGLLAALRQLHEGAATQTSEAGLTLNQPDR